MSSCSEESSRPDSAINLAVLKSWSFSAWQREHGSDQLPYRMDHLQRRGIRLNWTDRLHEESWQEGRKARLLHRIEASGVQFAQTALMAPVIHRSDATLAMFESEANCLAAVRSAVPGRRGAPFIVLSCWLAHVLSQSSRLRRSGYRWAYRSVDRLYYFSQNQGPLLEEMLGMGPERLLHVPFGVDTETFAPLQEPVMDYVLAVGRDQGRDWGTFFEAAAGLDMPVKVCCRPSQIRGMRVPDNVQVIGQVDRATYRALLGRALVVAVLTRAVDYPTGQSVLLEAMAMGRTVVVTDTPALAEYVRDGVDCLATAVGDPTSARARIEQAAGDAALRRRIGEAARRVVESRYSSRLMWDTVAQEIIELVGTGR